MLGHVASSVGSALPGSGALNPLVGQMIFIPGAPACVIPEGAEFAFLEAIGPGGSPGSGTNVTSGGGAGNDAIIAVVAGQTISASIEAQQTGGASPTTISIAGVTVLSAAGGPNGSFAGAAGKYPGGSGNSSNRTGGKGGGRLAGRPSVNSANPPYPVGHGGGTSNGFGGQGLVVVTFFRTRDAAFAFANSLYNGAWVP